MCCVAVEVFNYRWLCLVRFLDGDLDSLLFEFLFGGMPWDSFFIKGPC
jgi:hypothetical protein